MAPGFGFGYCMSPFWTAPSLGCMPMTFPGFYRSQINWDMVHESGRYNIAANLMSETMNTDALMYQVRDLRYNQGYTNPYFGGFNLPNPKDYAAALQPQLNAMFTQFMNNINNQANAAANNNNGIVGVNPNSTDPKEIELGKTLGVLQNIKGKITVTDLTSDTQSKLNKAFENKGTIEERLKNAQDALKALKEDSKCGEDKIKQILLSSDNDIVRLITNSGYDLHSKPYVFAENKEGSDERNFINLAGNAIDEISKDPDSYGSTSTFTSLTNICGEDEKKVSVLRKISYLNDKAVDAKGKSFIELLVGINSTGKLNGDEGQLWKTALQNINASLISKAGDLLNDITNDDIKKQVKDAKEKLSKDFDNYVSDYNKNKATAFAKSFNELYAICRQVGAQLAQNKAKDKFGYLNGAVANLINDDLIVKETKADLTNEKVSAPTVDLAKMRTKVEAPAADGAQGAGGEKKAPQTAQERADALVSSHDLDEFATVGDTKIYKTKTTSAITVCDPKFYAVTKDGKFVELKNVKSVNQATGKCKTLDNKEVELKDVTKEEINDEDVKNYRQLVLDLVSLTTGSKPKLTATPNSGSAAFKGVRLYKSSKGEYYMTINNKLAKLKETVEPTGELKGTGVYIWELAANDESKYFDYVTKDSIDGASQANRSNSVKFTLYSQDINNAVYAGYSMHYELNGNSNSGNYRNAKDEFDKFNKYKSAAQVASFIEGFNKASGGVNVSAGCKICYQIFTEYGESGYFDENYRKNAVKNIVSKVRTYLIPRTNLNTELLQKAKETIENFDNENITNASCSKVDNAIQQIVDAYYKQHPNIKKHVKSY